jgi:AcrR family transcriptional regulator
VDTVTSEVGVEGGAGTDNDVAARHPTARGSARERLLVAARELLTEVPLNTITVRLIAGRAGVGHTLITRYYGSRAGLLLSAIGNTLGGIATDIANAPDIHAAVRGAFNRVQQHPQLTAAINTLTTETQAVEENEGFPIVEAFAAQLEAAGVPPARARQRAAIITVMTFGWVGPEPRWLRMAGLDGDPTTGRYVYLQTLLELVDNAIQPPPPGERPPP